MKVVIGISMATLLISLSMAASNSSMENCSANQGLMNLDMLRDSLISQEDTIIYSLIQRAKYPINSRLYEKNPNLPGGSLFHFLLTETESLQSKAGRYTSPEENAFFPNNLSPPLVSHPSCGAVLHPGASSININDKILDLYLNTWLPLVTLEGDDKNYAATAASDIECLQALSRRIHFGKFVAEVKFKGAPGNYTPAIQAKDRDALMKLLTFESVEETIIERVRNKTKMFAQYVDDDKNEGKYKVYPFQVSGLYKDTVIPLTKSVQVEYLLSRLE